MQPQLTVFYDGLCPLCVKEIRALQRLDKMGKLQLEDIYADDFHQRFPEVDVIAAERILHGKTAAGQWLTGLDVTVLAWRLVGQHRWLKVLRLPLIKPVADMIYRGFARYRHRLSFWLTGQRRCERCKHD